MFSYRGVGCEEVALGAVDTNAIMAAGTSLLTSYLGVQDAQAKAKAQAAAARAALAEESRAQMSLQRWLVAGAVVGGAMLLALVVIAASQKGK